MGHLRAVPVRRHLAGAGGQRRHIRRLGGDPARRRPCWPNTTPAPSTIRRCTRCRFMPTSTAGSTTDLRRRTRSRCGLGRSPGWRPGSVHWPTSGSIELLPRGSFDLTQDYGGIVAASVVCELVGMSADLAPMCWPPSTRAAWPSRARAWTPPRRGLAISNTSMPMVQRRRADGVRRREPSRRGRPARLPAARRLRTHRRRGCDTDAGRLHRRNGDRAEDRRARAVGTGPPARPDVRGARRPRSQCAGGP